MHRGTETTTSTARRRLVAAAAAGLLLVVAGCSSDDGGDDSAGGTTTSTEAGASTGTGNGEAPACDQGPTIDPVESEPVEGGSSDHTVTSFDGTGIRIHWFPLEEAVDEPLPVVMVGPGWGMPGATDDGVDALGLSSSPIDGLHEAGFNVLTWDPRGFGESEGEATINDPEREGRDVQVLLDWLATQPEVELDRDGDPRVGMLGGSYGGGIQLVLAGLDCRVDAIVPSIAWHSLLTSLYPGDTVKSGWSGLLMQGVGAFGGTVDEHISDAAEEGTTVGTLDDELVDWFGARGPGDLVSEITAPTLIVHGTADTLFTPTEAVANYAAPLDAGTTVAMLWGCGGHGICLTPGEDRDLLDERSIAWLDKYLKGSDVDTGPTVDLLDQEGERWVGDEYPVEADATLSAEGDGGTLALTEASAAGPIPTPEDADLFAGVVTGITPGRADEAVELTLSADDDALVLGAPKVTFTYTGTTPDGPQPTRLFAQLVDDETDLVLGNQIIPIPTVLDGSEQTAEVDLEVVLHHLRAGTSVTLQLVATTPAFTTPRLGGEVTITDLALELPTTDVLSPA